MIKSAWRCELPLWKTFWVLHWLGTLFVAFLASGLMIAVGWFSSIPEHAFIPLAAGVVITVTLLWNFATMVLVWGNAGNIPHKPWRILAQAYVIINIIYLLLSLLF
jgi:hypothetical protein